MYTAISNLNYSIFLVLLKLNIILFINIYTSLNSEISN